VNVFSRERESLFPLIHKNQKSFGLYFRNLVLCFQAIWLRYRSVWGNPLFKQLRERKREREREKRKQEILLPVPQEMTDLVFSPVDLGLSTFSKFNEGCTWTFGNRTDFQRFSIYFGSSDGLFDASRKYFIRHVRPILETPIANLL